MVLLISACHRPALTCRSEYLYPFYLASEQINTPDPKRECFLGQQIIICWEINKHCFEAPTTLLLHLRYGNRETKTVSRVIGYPKGWCIYSIMNENFKDKCGILSFQVEMIQNAQVIERWKHFLWADLL